VRLRFLGPPVVEVGGATVRVHSRRALAVLAYVAVNRGRHARADLAARFWEDAPEQRARANLRSLLSTLQSQVPGVLTVTRDAVALAAAPGLAIDVSRFVDLAASGTDRSAARETRIEACTHALELFGGEFLPGFERLGITELTTWLETERDVLRRRAVHLATELVELELLERRPAHAAEVATRLIALDEYREASYLVSMRALVANGEPQDALREFARCRARIVDDLGLALGDEILALEQEIREEPASSVRPVLSRTNPLPGQGPLFGRETLLAALVGAERSAFGGLLTLCGPAGVGKTSLAIAAAHCWRERGDDVVFVDATNAVTADHLVTMLVDTIASNAPSGTDALQAVTGVLADRPVRLVLDNIEQIDAASSVIDVLLAGCPNLLVLATSRRPAGSDAEDVVVVPSLDLPTDEETRERATSDEVSSDALSQLACVRVFERQSRSVSSEPASNDADLRTIGRICRLLDGLPLAIELVAARRQLIGLTEIEASLRTGLAGGDLSLADGGRRDAPERHHSLRAALTSTVALLDPAARSLFVQMSVFAGRFTFDSVLAVCGLDDRGRVMRSVQTLIDFHLLRRADVHGRVWFDMLASVRALAAEMLASCGDGELVRARRVDHDCELVERVADESRSPANTSWYRYLDEYLPTLRLTLDELHETRDGRELAVATSLTRYWFDRGRVAEAHRRLIDAEGATSDGRPWLPALSRLWQAGMRAEALGYGTASDALADVDRALEDVRAAGPPVVVELDALQFAVHAHIVDDTADLTMVPALIAEGVDLATSVGHLWFRAAFECSLGVVHHVSGDDERAASLFRTVVADADLHGNDRFRLSALMLLDIIGAPGPDGRATPKMNELLDLAIDLGDQRQTMWLTMSLGTVAALEGDLHTSAAYFLDALTMSRDADYFIGVGCCLMGGAALAIMCDDVTSAVRFHACVEPDLESLGRAMPRSYLEVYRQLTEHLPAVRDADAAVAAAWSRGSIEPRGVTLTELVRYLARVRDSSAALST
jgi:predicted ATPase/DNA-binding SARP family transcriptional activator